MSREPTTTTGVVVVGIPTDAGGYVDEGDLHELNARFVVAERAKSTRAIILAGSAPGVFVRSFSLRALETTVIRLEKRAQRYPVGTLVPERPWDSLFRRIENSPIPVIAAIAGTAEGIGFELALACDYRILERGDYVVGLPEVRIGTLPGAGGTQRLTRLIGPSQAKRVILFGEHLTPDQAHALGFADELVGHALLRAHERAEMIAASPGEAIAAAKRLIHLASEASLSSGLEDERRTFLDLLGGAEMRKRVSLLNASGRDLSATDDIFPPSPRTAPS